MLLLLHMYALPLVDLLTFEDLAAEIVMTLCSAIGLVLAVPITTAIAVLLATPARLGDRVTPAERRPRYQRPAPENEMLRPLDWEF